MGVGVGVHLDHDGRQASKAWAGAAKGERVCCSPAWRGSAGGSAGAAKGSAPHPCCSSWMAVLPSHCRAGRPVGACRHLLWLLPGHGTCAAC